MKEEYDIIICNDLPYECVITYRLVSMLISSVEKKKSFDYV